MKFGIIMILSLISCTVKAQEFITHSIWINNTTVLFPPTANAGSNVAITLPVDSVTLIGSGSDFDGTIISSLWVQTSGPTTANIIAQNSTTTKILNLSVPGVYEFTFTVMDNDSLSGSSIAQVTVNQSINIPPTVSVGPNLKITLPDSDTTLTAVGADSDGTISSYSWVQLSGPASTIVSPGSASTDVTGLIVTGLYRYEVTVTDNRGGTAKNTIYVIVDPAIPPANLSPVANAGSDIIINL